MDSDGDIFITQNTFCLDNTVDTVTAGGVADDLFNLNMSLLNNENEAKQETEKYVNTLSDISEDEVMAICEKVEMTQKQQDRWNSFDVPLSEEQVAVKRKKRYVVIYFCDVPATRTKQTVTFQSLVIWQILTIMLVRFFFFFVSLVVLPGRGGGCFFPFYSTVC